MWGDPIPFLGSEQSGILGESLKNVAIFLTFLARSNFFEEPEELATFSGVQLFEAKDHILLLAHYLLKRKVVLVCLL